MSSNKKRIFFICGSLNQTTQMYKISQQFNDYECYFTPYYMGDWREILDNWLLKYTVLGPQQRQRTMTFLTRMGCQIDWKGLRYRYDFVFTCSDIVIQKNIRHKPTFLVQEGMTDPEKVRYRLVKLGLLPRYAAGSSITGLSKQYRLFFVASEGYKELFVGKGVPLEKLRVTGIPNFDDFQKCRHNDFPHHHYVLAITSNLRECGEFENRREFILRAQKLANGRKLIFKLHPAENLKRAAAEIRRWAPEAITFTEGVTEHMVANCDVFITRQSSVVYAALALGKEVHADLDQEQLKKLLPIQNSGTSAQKIAHAVREYMEQPDSLAS